MEEYPDFKIYDAHAKEQNESSQYSKKPYGQIDSEVRLNYQNPRSNSGSPFKNQKDHTPENHETFLWVSPLLKDFRKIATAVYVFFGLTFCFLGSSMINNPSRSNPMEIQALMATAKDLFKPNTVASKDMFVSYQPRKEAIVTEIKDPEPTFPEIGNRDHEVSLVLTKSLHEDLRKIAFQAERTNALLQSLKDNQNYTIEVGVQSFVGVEKELPFNSEDQNISSAEQFDRITQPNATPSVFESINVKPTVRVGFYVKLPLFRK